MLDPKLSARLRSFRQELYGALGLRQDSLFELMDAVLTAPEQRTLVRLSLCPCFRRCWSSAGQWSTARLSVARTGIQAVVVADQLLLVGGSGDDRTASRAVDIYDAHTNQWSSTQLSQAREFVGGALGPALTEAALSPGLSEATASQAVDVYEVTSGRRGISPRPQPVSVRHADWCLTVGEAGPVVCLSECSIVVSTDP